MAPNPVMGGHVVHVPTERVCDVDMTVEEGIRSIVTSGVAIGESDDGAVLDGADATTDDVYPPARGFHASGAAQEPTPRTTDADRESAYTEDIDPQHAETPDDVARSHREGTVGSDSETPSDIEPSEEEQN